MKTAISLPDELFRQAERMAKRLRVSRSHLYATALTKFLAGDQPERVTAKLNEVYSQSPAEIHPELQRAQLKLLKPNRW